MTMTCTDARSLIWFLMKAAVFNNMWYVIIHILEIYSILIIVVAIIDASYCGLKIFHQFLAALDRP